MPEIKITPWESPGDLGRLRSLFYGNEKPDRPKLQRKACDVVSAWIERGNVPHAIVSTSNLVNAMLVDAGGGSSAQTVSAVYCSALSQFVTGTTDIQQNSQLKKSMYSIAKTIRLPASFIELRHRITHANAPSNKELRLHASYGLKWLSHSFWKFTRKSESPSDTEEPGDELPTMADLPSQLTPPLHDFAKNWNDAVGTTSDAVAAACKHRLEVVAKVAEACKNQRYRLRVLSDILLTDDLLLFRGKPSPALFLRKLNCWDGLLQLLAQQQKNFLSILVDEMQFRLAQSPHDNLQQDAKFMALCEWLIHIFLDKSWHKQRWRLKLSAEGLVDTCLIAPSRVTEYVAGKVLASDEWQSIKDEYSGIAGFVAHFNGLVHKPNFKPGSGNQTNGGGSTWVPKAIGVCEDDKRRGVSNWDREAIQTWRSNAVDVEPPEEMEVDEEQLTDDGVQNRGGGELLAHSQIPVLIHQNSRI